MRYACKMRDLPFEQFCLPKIKHAQKLPTVLNNSEVKRLLEVCKLLKYRLLLGLCYGYGLRCPEVRNLCIGEADTAGHGSHSTEQG